VHPKHRTEFKTPPGLCILRLGQPESLLFQYFLSSL